MSNCSLYSDLALKLHTLGSEASLIASSLSSSALAAIKCLMTVNVSFKLCVSTLNTSGEEAKYMPLGHLRINSMSY